MQHKSLYADVKSFRNLWYVLKPAENMNMELTFNHSCD